MHKNKYTQHIPARDGLLEGFEPILILHDVMTGRNVGDAVDEVQRGRQRLLATSTQLPVVGSLGHCKGTIEQCAEMDAAWEATGIQFAPITDPLFRDVVLPAGWRVRASDHPMWSHLVDQHGRIRARIFYKTEIFRSEAHIHLEARFSIQRVHSKDPTIEQVQYAVMDGDRQRFETDRMILGPKPTDEQDRRNWFARQDQLETQHRAECGAWLNERYPSWRQYGAHWNDE